MAQNYPSGVPGYSWAGQPPQTMNPFAEAGTSMIQDFAIMQQREQMQMYQRAMVSLPNRSISQQYDAAYNPDFTFGMMGGLDSERNNLQRRSNVAGTNMTIAAGSAAAGYALWGPAAKLSAWGAAKIFGGNIAPGIARTFVPFALLKPVYDFADMAMDRNRMAQDISTDVEDYSKRWTRGVGFSRQDINRLGTSMMQDMTRPGQFFRSEDQLKINKMGLASGMLRGNDIDEYKKNFEDLKKNAKDVMTALQTTVEGGMSFMKEMRDIGVRGGGQQRQQAMSAFGMGGLSGIGTSNMMQLGAAGARNAQGTGWSAQGASNMYMGIGTQLTMAAQSSASVANSVTGLGGLPNATAVVSNMAMNFARSGMGLRAITSVMDHESRAVDPLQLHRLLTGKMSTGEMLGRSSSYGSNTLRRANAQFDSMDALNQLSSQDQLGLAQSTYAMWAKDRGGVNRSTANAFASQFGNNFEGIKLFGGMLFGNNNVASMESAQRYSESALRMSQIGEYQTSWARGVNIASNNITSNLHSAGDYTIAAAGSLASAVGAPFRGVRSIYRSAVGYTAPIDESADKIVHGVGDLGKDATGRYYSPVENYRDQILRDQRRGSAAKAIEPAISNLLSSGNLRGSNGEAIIKALSGAAASVVTTGMFSSEDAGVRDAGFSNFTAPALLQGVAALKKAGKNATNLPDNIVKLLADMPDYEALDQVQGGVGATRNAALILAKLGGGVTNKLQALSATTSLLNADTKAKDFDAGKYIKEVEKYVSKDWLQHNIANYGEMRGSDGNLNKFKAYVGAFTGSVNIDSDSQGFYRAQLDDLRKGLQAGFAKYQEEKTVDNPNKEFKLGDYINDSKNSTKIAELTKSASLIQSMMLADQASGGAGPGIVNNNTPPNILNYWNSNWRIGQ